MDKPIFDTEIISCPERYDVLQVRIKDVEQKMAGLRVLLASNDGDLAAKKQMEINNLQKELLADLENILKTNQRLQFAEEAIFGNIVSYRLRSGLRSIKGQLIFTLERLKLIEPNTLKTNTLNKISSRLRLLIFGPGELKNTFVNIKTNLDCLINALEEHLMLLKHDAPAPKTLHLDELVNSIVAEVFTNRKPELKVQYLVEPDLPRITGDYKLLTLALKAVFDNAVEALPSGRGAIKIHVGFHPTADEVQICVQDTGQGINFEFKEKIFEPFFTTKAGHKGLGLYRARQYVSWHLGKINLVNSDSQGSQFMLTLPIHAPH